MSVFLMVAGVLVIGVSVNMAHSQGWKDRGAGNSSNSPLLPWFVSFVGTWALVGGTWMEAA